jgi:hypothetical protein
MAAMSGALVRMLVGDHTALLAFLGWAWPVGTLSNALVQLACLYLVSRQNEAMCNSPVSAAGCAACLCCICPAGRALPCCHAGVLAVPPPPRLSSIANFTVRPPAAAPLPPLPATLPLSCSTCVVPALA